MSHFLCHAVSTFQTPDVLCTEEGRACRHDRDTVFIQDAPGAFAKAVAKALRHVRDQNWTEELSRRDYAVVCRLMLGGYTDSQITDGMDPVIRRECRAGMRQKHWTYLPRTISAVEEDLFGV